MRRATIVAATLAGLFSAEAGSALRSSPSRREGSISFADSLSICSSSGVEYLAESAQNDWVLAAVHGCGQNTTLSCPSGDLTTESLCEISGKVVIQRKFNSSLGIGPTADSLRKITGKELPIAATCEAKIIEDKCIAPTDTRINAILGGTLGALGGIITVASLWICCRKRCANKTEEIDKLTENMAAGYGSATAVGTETGVGSDDATIIGPTTGK